MIDLTVPFPATDQWKARESLRWASEQDVHHHGNTPLRRWNIQSKRVVSARDGRTCSCSRAVLTQFTILYPNEALLRLAFRGTAAYQLSWFDAHLWAYAEYYSLEELLSEDFQHDRLYGTVRAVNPFL
jgi:hypothetical protein